jgi:hypothetical protein
MDNQKLSKKQIIAGLVLAAVVIFGLAWCQFRDDGGGFVRLEDIRDKVDWTVRPDLEPKAEQAVQQFFEFCRIPTHQFDDLDEWKVKLIDDGHFGTLWSNLFGWRHYIKLSFKVDSNVKNRASGHRLTYVFGGGTRPGILSEKPVATTYCIHLAGGPAKSFEFAEVAGMKVMGR